MIQLPTNLRGRSLLALKEFSPEEIRLMLDVAHEFKRMKKAGEPHRIKHRALV